MVWLKAFVSGFLATLIFHQGLYSLFYLGGIVPNPPFNLTPVPPLGIPQVVSLAFFGGLWGMALWPVLKNLGRNAFVAAAVVLGAVAPTAVAMLVVFPLKGIEVSAQTWIGGFLLNGFWGLGVMVFLLLTGARKLTRT